MKIFTAVMVALIIFSLKDCRENPVFKSIKRELSFTTKEAKINRIGKTPTSNKNIIIFEEKSSGNIWILEEDPLVEYALKRYKTGDEVKLVLRKKGSSKEVYSILPLL